MFKGKSNKDHNQNISAEEERSNDSGARTETGSRDKSCSLKLSNIDICSYSEVTKFILENTPGLPERIRNPKKLKIDHSQIHSWEDLKKVILRTYYLSIEEDLNSSILFRDNPEDFKENAYVKNQTAESVRAKYKDVRYVSSASELGSEGEERASVSGPVYYVFKDDHAFMCQKVGCK